MNASLKTSMIVTFAAGLLMSACAGEKDMSPGGPDLRPLNINESSLAGAWQMETQVTEQLDSRGNKIVRNEIKQLSISGKRLTVIISDDVKVKSLLSADFEIANGTLVFAKGSKISDVKVVSVTGSTLKLLEETAVAAVNQGRRRGPPVVQEVSYRRIDPSMLATLRFKSITQSFNFTLAGGNVSVEEHATATYPSLEDSQTQIQCRYDQSRRNGNDLIIKFDKIVKDRGETHFLIVGAVDFNFRNPTETVPMKIAIPRRGGSSESFDGLVTIPNAGSGRDRGVSLSLEERSRCEFNVTREKNNVSFNGTCSRIRMPVRDNERSEQAPKINIQGDCVLAGTN